MTILPNTILRGPAFPEPVQVIVVTSRGTGTQIIGRGVNTNQVYDRILTPEQIGKFEPSPENEPFDGSPRKFRLGIEALRLGLAYRIFRSGRSIHAEPAMEKPKSSLSMRTGQSI